MNTSRLLRIRLLLGFAALLCFTPGCNDKASTPPTAAALPAPPPASPRVNSWEGRLMAAMAISDINKRDGALQMVADTAAADGNESTVKKAVLQMADVNKRDEAAGSAALSLAKAGKRAEATDIALLMCDINKRDDTLFKIAAK